MEQFSGNICTYAFQINRKVSKALDTGKIVVCVFLDLKTDFDTVDHTILLRKLKLYGTHGKVHDWFSSYLNNRTQFVHYNYYNSEKKTHYSWCSPRLDYGASVVQYINKWLFLMLRLTVFNFIRWWHKRFHWRHKLWQNNRYFK